MFCVHDKISYDFADIIPKNISGFIVHEAWNALYSACSQSNWHLQNIDTLVVFQKDFEIAGDGVVVLRG